MVVGSTISFHESGTSQISAFVLQGVVVVETRDSSLKFASDFNDALPVDSTSPFDLLQKKNNPPAAPQ
jgi:hypothetical protein